MAYNNLYREVANPLFEADGRGVLPSDPDGYPPDDLVISYESAHRLANEEPLTARDVRSALWLCAGNVTRAAKRLGIPPARIRSFARNSRIQQEFAEARERILDRAEAVLHEALFSDDPKRCDSAAQYLLKKSQSGRTRFHALTDHLQLDPKADRPVFQWVG